MTREREIPKVTVPRLDGIDFEYQTAAIVRSLRTKIPPPPLPLSSPPPASRRVSAHRVASSRRRGLVERSGGKVGPTIIVRKMKTIAGSAESRNTTQANETTTRLRKARRRAGRVRACECVRTRIRLPTACVSLHARWKRGRERETSMLGPCDHTCASKEGSHGVAGSAANAGGKKKTRERDGRKSEPLSEHP